MLKRARMIRKIRRLIGEDIHCYIRSEGKKSAFLQLKELVMLGKYYKYIPYHYIKHCMYLRSFDGDIFDYVPPELIHRYRNHLNREGSHNDVIDKKRFCEIMMQNDLRVVPTLFVISRDRSLRDKDGNLIDFNEFRRSLLESKESHFFIKPYDGGSGRGIYKMSLCDQNISINSNIAHSESDLYRILFNEAVHGGYIVQKAIRQHELINKINPSSVNTIRIDTLLVDDEVFYNAALLRVGNKESYTDNWANGGFIVNIDLDTGILDSHAKTKAKYGRLDVEAHPTSGFRFEGATIPFWSEVKELVRSAAFALYPLRSLGWDIAIAHDGPVIIETNHDFDIFMSQEALKGLRRSAIGQLVLNKRLI